MMECMLLLCVLVSSLCAILLLRAFQTNRNGLLPWTALCFIGLAVENCVLFLDLVVLPTQVDLSIVRNVSALFGLVSLSYGFLWRGNE